MNDKLLNIEDICDNWTQIDKIASEVNISENIHIINCDTRDFAINWSTEPVRTYSNATCGFETESNKGIAKFYNLIHKENRKKYTINKTEIIKWLKELCSKTGGVAKEWRYLVANVKNCENWNLKYIRFVKNNHCTNEFIVCNNYFYPIEYKDIINNLKLEVL